VTVLRDSYVRQGVTKLKEGTRIVSSKEKSFFQGEKMPPRYQELINKKRRKGKGSHLDYKKKDLI